MASNYDSMITVSNTKTKPTRVNKITVVIITIGITETVIVIRNLHLPNSVVEFKKFICLYHFARYR